MVRAIILGFAFLLALTLTNADTIKCYTCNKCDELGDATTEDCEKSCYTQTVNGDVNRGCIDDNYCDDKEDCTTCNSDECNSATSATSSLILAVGSILLLKMYY